MKADLEPFRIHSNGRLRSIVLPDGRGGLMHDWVAITRWSEAAPEATGPMMYLRDAEDWRILNGKVSTENWSARLEVRVARDEAVELRRITLENHLDAPQEIELTTYAEVALNHPMGDAGHPAFSKLFVQTEEENRILLARRRPRGMNENWPWVGQALLGDFSDLSWETNRATFIGRGRSLHDPQAMDQGGDLSGETGNVLDPVLAWRCRVVLEAGETRQLWLLTAVAQDKASVRELLEKTEPVAWFADAPLRGSARVQALAAEMMLGSRNRVVPESVAGSSVVHRFPLSPDEIRVIAMGGRNCAGTREVISLMPEWRELGLAVRLFVMEENGGEAISDAVIVKPSEFSGDELAWWLASAHLVVGEEPVEVEGADFAVLVCSGIAVEEDEPELPEELRFFNGTGGFSRDGREYVILLPLKNGRLVRPPMPWSNVLANPRFGCLVTEGGAGYTWARNSQANRLTPWSNDPIRDPQGEALFLRDETTGETWSPLPGPCAAKSAFVVRHGFGYSKFLSKITGLSQEVEFLVPPDDPVKLVTLRLKNTGAVARKLSFAAVHRLVLGANPDRHHATLAWTDGRGVQHAVNPRAGDFADGRVFSEVLADGVKITKSAGGNSFGKVTGRHGFAEPELRMEGERGFGRDACFARKVDFELEAGEEAEFVVILGEALSEEEENGLLEKYRRAGAAESAREETIAHWRKILQQLQIRTPLPEVDVMVNGWLVYQNLACRIWGRSAFYQSGGAYGFRDQLQDAAAFALTRPELLRSQILLHAAQQFPEGDVTHWWHPEPLGTGMRTKFSDDLLWLPWLTDHYMRTTGDFGILDEVENFIEGPQLGANEDEEYMKPAVSRERASVFEHCCRSLDRSLTKGEHGLPLMGIGDWNDGMSRIGREGRGESVWMGFFLYEILRSWIPLCEARGETERAKRYAEYREELLDAINAAGWDGEWYRRAYYDDGTPLGTHTDSECRIDALAQAWAVISKAAPEDRGSMALDALERELVDDSVGIVRLLHSPFVDTPHDPGYIKGYVAGVRENGGQYTHAACWVVRAMAEAGRRDEAAKLLQRLSPVWQARDAETVARYQVEPYAIAADIYGAPPHVGRGGWTWYTGSAGWMFRVAVESVLGLTIENGDTFVLSPRIPDSWPGFAISFRTPSGKTVYQIEVKNPSGKAGRVTRLEVDGESIGCESGIACWPLRDDGQEHRVSVEMG
ncbi:MAG: glycosyl transferase [Luteolibacter sp.]